MAIEDSRLKGGTLTLDALPFGKQMTAVTLTPSTEEDGEELETLTGDRIEADERSTWTLDLGAVQDFNDPAGFVEYARANAGEVVPFSWSPNAVGAPSYAGTVRVRPVAIGGETVTRLQTTASWPVIGEPEPTYAP